MKELTIEQKAQRYDEAIERYKAKQEYESQKVHEFIEYLFPELAESEDEKIRKELIEQVVYIVPNGDEVDSEGDILPIYQKRIDKYRAWLEKQGEQILANSCKTCKDEQKPSWSEEDEKQARQIERIVHDDGCTQKLQKQIADWLKSLKGRVQPKQDWSQNDIDMIGWLIRCCEKEHEELCNDKYGHQDIVSDLKRDCRKKWDWLESLKSRVAPQKQWKPSEEQIKVCKEVYADILSAKGFNIGTVNSELNRLEEQLKNLI